MLIITVYKGGVKMKIRQASKIKTKQARVELVQYLLFNVLVMLFTYLLLIGPDMYNGYVWNF